MNPKHIILVAALVPLGALLTGCASSPSVFATHGPEAAQTAMLTWLMFGIAAIVLIIITILILLVFLRPQSKPEGTDVYANDQRNIRSVLLGGGFVPIMVLMVVMGIGIGVENRFSDPADANPLTIEVIGHQWWWEVHYTKQNFDTANEIHIPAGQPVTVRVTTADVIHSFWVPQLHGKIDTIPGQTNTITLEADQPGIYRGQCAEFCGAQHANMAFLVIADKPDAFQAWLADQEKPSVEPKVGSIEQQGQQAFLGSACNYCHTIRGTNASGKIGPDLTHIASRTTIAAALLPNSRGNLAGWIINSQSIKPDNHMPPMDLTSAQLQAMLDYFATLK
jgi:cytochrome c oxidase subunit 2